MPRCAGKKEEGSPCERIVGASQPYCYSHDPNRAAERQRNASRGGRSKANAEIAGLKAQLERVMNLGGNRIEMRIPRSDWFPRDLRFPHS
jgi:hypothetical protein